MSHALLWWVVAAQAAGGFLLAQAPAPHRDLTISVDVEQVVLNVSVQDREGRHVPDLTQVAFQVFEEGQLQQIEHFSRQEVPVTVGLVVDTSRSMQPKYAEVVAAAMAFVQASNPKDEVFLVNFNEHPRFTLPESQPFTSDPHTLRRALLEVTPDGQTALHDAIDLALRQMRQGSWDKQVLLVVSDGGDNASRLGLDQVVSQVERSKVILYAIGLSDDRYEDRNPKVLKRLARATGGKAYFGRERRDITGVCEAIARDIRSQYILAYRPNVQDPHAQKKSDSFRRVRVTATSPEGRKLMVRTREGYYLRRRP